jgi:hypothetical protein
MLLERIKVIEYHNDGKTRFWLNSGTQIALENPNYLPEAYIPKSDWKEANLEEKKIITTKPTQETIDKSKHIGVVKIPEKIMAMFRELKVTSISSPEDCVAISKQPGYGEVMTQLAEYILPLSVDDESLICRGIYLNPPGLITVTCDRRRRHALHDRARRATLGDRNSGCYIGLHFDSWDQLPLEERDSASNRICLNLGKEDRYLLFINLTVADILQLIESLGEAKITSANALKNRFLKLYPDYPVIKVRVSPGEAYIAPTENMIHDGSSLGQNSCDLHLTVRGHLQLPLLDLTSDLN